jgi:hexokinase
MKIQDMQTLKKAVISELKNAQLGEKSSISYIHHTLPEKSLVKDGEEFQVLVVGGTVLRSAICRKKEKTVSIINSEKSSPPKFDTFQSFFDCIFEYLSPNISVLALNFAYPLSPVYENGVLDGILLSGTKENIFDGLVGVQIGKIISEEFYKRYQKEIVVSVANDTICLLLSGISVYEKENIIGGIVGTGVNFALFDKGEAINLEAANFNKFTQTRVGKLLDSQSEHPGKSQFEKVISGAYLYKYYNNSTATQYPDFTPLTSTQELEMVSRGNTKLAQLAKVTFEYSASLVAAFIAGILEFKENNSIAIMEGSLFWKADDYKSLVETYISMLTPYTIEFQQIDKDSILGAAELVI